MVSKEFPQGVRFYTSGTARVRIHFPEQSVRCQYCPFCRSEKELERYWCRLTNEMLYDPFNLIGGDCPIDFDKEE